MGNLTTAQKIAIAMVFLGVLSTSGVQLTDMVGPTIARSIVSTSNLLNSMLAGVIAVLTGQGAVVKQVLDMKGVERLRVNENANPTLAAIAMDPNQAKISATPEAQAQVAATAKGDNNA